jgi:hypothetical protein
MTQLTVPKAIEALNQLSQQRWGSTAPTYSFVVRHGQRSLNQPNVYLIHRVRQDLSPYVMADELWARGERDHVLAKLRSAIRYAST